MATITFFGGAGGVTGSKHLVEAAGTRVLLDCGTFQGLPDVRERNRGFPFAPDGIDHVILSHAHIDHCGMLPLLVKRGFAGSIFTTPATRDVAELMMTDMAKIEEQDAAYRRKRHLGAPDEREPLFTIDDIPETMARFVPVPYVRERNGWTTLADGWRLKLYDAGHILGSAMSVIEVTEGDRQYRLAYSGDVGAPGTPLLYDPQSFQEDVQMFIMESTYGSRVHEPPDGALERMAVAIRSIHARGGKMIVPAFSLGRTQVLVYLLHKLTDEGRIPRFPIYVDSPLAVNLTDVYKSHRQNYDLESWADFSGPDHKPLAFSNLTYTQSVEESKELNTMQGPFMVISASGMMTAGRVVHHLRNSIDNPRNAVFITGYQAAGTLGRRILEGATNVELYGTRKDVRAEVYIFNEFSAHADSQQLQQLLESVRGLQRVILVHGEPHQADDLAAGLSAAHPDWDVTRPDEGDVVSF